MIWGQTLIGHVYLSFKKMFWLELIFKIQRHSQGTYSPRHHFIKKCLRLISLKANNPGATEYPPAPPQTQYTHFIFFFPKWNFNVAQQAGASLLNSIANENLSTHFLSDKVMFYSCVSQFLFTFVTFAPSFSFTFPASPENIRNQGPKEQTVTLIIIMDFSDHGCQHGQ